VPRNQCQFGGRGILLLVISWSGSVLAQTPATPGATVRPAAYSLPAGSIDAEPPAALTAPQATPTYDLPTVLPMGAPPCRPWDPDIPRDVRDGSFQKLFFDDTWLPRFGDNGFGMEDIETRAVFGLPCPTTKSPLLLTPGFGAHFLDGPASRDLPPRVYDAYLQMRWLTKLTPQWGVELGVTPGVYSDFQQSSSKALRITGHAAVAWRWSSEWQMVLGATYLDRTDIPALPIAGLIWTPDPDTRFEMLFPKSKLAHRVYLDGRIYPNVEDWVFLGAELGGGTWAIHQSDTNTVTNYSDYRIYLGFERKRFFRLSGRVELGYVFGRKINFTNDEPNFYPSDTMMVQATLSY
jgi:hypothetical protein